MNYARIILNDLKTLAEKQAFENTHGSGSFARLVKDAGPGAIPEGSVTRSAFEEMDPLTQMEHVRSGKLVYDEIETEVST